MKRIFWTGVIVFIILTGQSVSAADKLRAASGGFGTAINAIVPATYHLGVFKKYGLDIEYIALDSGTLGMQTLLANEIQVLFTTGALPVTSNLQGGDVTIIAGGINFFPFKLIVRPEIKAPEDLKGKTVAISRFGSASDFAAVAALEKLGVNPKQTTMMQLGGNPSRLAGLAGGSVQATVFSEPYASVAVKKFGMREILDLADSGIPFPQNCFMVRRSYLEQNRSKVVNFMKGVIEGLYALKKEKAATIKVIKKYLRIDDDEMAAIGYDYYLVKHGDGILTLPDRKGLEFVIAEVARTNPKAKGQTPESLRLLEPNVLEEVKKSGFVEKVKQ
ncbi:MAG TPA: ABC transporter substrate-binding protein [Candidatus Binatia bacterium]|jgi:NitT/TauT family transport system substrate-binding protein|nr:ABC transporter substrate-binding protein [Candidatus Binatia bacterium]